VHGLGELFGRLVAKDLGRKFRQTHESNALRPLEQLRWQAPDALAGKAAEQERINVLVGVRLSRTAQVEGLVEPGVFGGLDLKLPRSPLVVGNQVSAVRNHRNSHVKSVHD
jgi:hypothetical protein